MFKHSAPVSDILALAAQDGCRKGNRPSFTDAGDPETAERLYQYIIQQAKEQMPVVETGVFGAEMKVSLVNDGPFTILLEDL